MKVSGFTICKNIVKFDYPIVEAIRSALPLVDEFVVNVGRSDDGTLDLIRSIGSEKIRIVESVWDDVRGEGGAIFAKQTNLALSHCTGEWGLYLQADEVLHEKDLPALRATMEDLLPKTEVLGLMFQYFHFFGDYWAVNPWGYHREIRIIRNNGAVESWGDGSSFSRTQDGVWLKSKANPAGRVMPSGGTIYHYGYVKQPKALLEKLRYQVGQHLGNRPPEELLQAFRVQGLSAEQHEKLWDYEEFPFEKYDIMKEFRGPHPAVMADRIARFPRLKRRRNRWLNWKFYQEVLRHGFKG